MCSSSTPAAMATKMAECAIPVPNPPKKTKRDCQIGVFPFQKNRRSTKQKHELTGARMVASLYRPVFLIALPVRSPPIALPATVGIK